MINVTLIPVHKDNYCYLLEAEDGSVGLVDPGEAGPVIATLKEKKLQPDVIFVTHHHWDHIDGIPGLLGRHSCPVAGPFSETTRILQMDILLDEDSAFEFGDEAVRVLETPGHTRGAICLYFPESGLLFTGDTLFSLGCGRLFEGTPEQMWNSLQKIIALPDETLIYCGHEYTQANAEFCLRVEPDNQALQKRSEAVKALRAKGQPTLPVPLKTEKETNVFLRAGSAERFAELRALKDRS
ncbi:MAG: hydroxyacylglutathione hydrolase [Rhodospirillales bacterium]|nr:hydroxyacylglutathione hydrolase [Rhodospirillales bacterium]